METSSSSPIKEERESRQTCLKLELSEEEEEKAQNSSKDSIFVKGTWFPSHFSLSITDGRDSWLCIASEEDVGERASQWDQSVSEYIEFAENYLGFQQPASVYRFSDAGNAYKRSEMEGLDLIELECYRLAAVVLDAVSGVYRVGYDGGFANYPREKKLSFTFEKEGIKLEWRWRCKPSPNSKKTTADILDFLMDENIKLSVEVVKKTESYEKLKAEAEKCLVQSEKLSMEKEEFETEVYAKFVKVLNSKKAKLRELQDTHSNQKVAGKQPQEEEVTSEGTVSYHSGSEDGADSEEKSDDFVQTSEDESPSKSRGRKRITRA